MVFTDNKTCDSLKSGYVMKAYIKQFEVIYCLINSPINALIFNSLQQKYQYFSYNMFQIYV